MTKAGAGIVKRNIAALDKHDPQTVERLSRISTPATSLVYDNGGIVNIDLGGGTLYPKPALEWTRDQLEEFTDNPDRLIFKDPSHCNLSGYSFKFFQPMQDYFKSKGIAEKLSAGPVVDIGFLFVFGIGLGYHLRDLVETTPAKRMILIEPLPEFMVHSLSAIEWRDIYKIADKRHQDIHLPRGKARGYRPLSRKHARRRRQYVFGRFVLLPALLFLDPPRDVRPPPGAHQTLLHLERFHRR
jgi:hypothetical protein